MVVVCVDVRDPGNAGTMIRTADAAGVGRRGLLRRNGRPHQSEDGAGVGRIDLPHPGGRRRRRRPRLIGSLRELGHDHGGHRGPGRRRLLRLRLVPAGGPGLRQRGLGARAGSVPELLDEGVSIPMVGRAESLNVSVSAAVVCFEALRQRRLSGGGPVGFAGRRRAGVLRCRAWMGHRSAGRRIRRAEEPGPAHA